MIHVKFVLLERANKFSDSVRSNRSWFMFQVFVRIYVVITAERVSAKL